MAEPEIVFRHGTCSASVFQNEFQRGKESFKTRTVSFRRRYRDKEGEWRTGGSLGLNDIPRAILVLNKAYEYLASNGQAEVEEPARV